MSMDPDMDVMALMGKTVRYTKAEVVDSWARYDPATMRPLQVAVSVVVEGVCEGFERRYPGGVTVRITGYGWVSADEVELVDGRPDGELADSIVRKIVQDERSCVMVEGGSVLIDTSWLGLDDDEAAYLKRVEVP